MMRKVLQTLRQGLKVDHQFAEKTTVRETLEWETYSIHI